jgi:hypothetical protein
MNRFDFKKLLGLGFAEKIELTLWLYFSLEKSLLLRFILSTLTTYSCFYGATGGFILTIVLNPFCFVNSGVDLLTCISFLSKYFICLVKSRSREW